MATAKKAKKPAAKKPAAKKPAAKKAAPKKAAAKKPAAKKAPAKKAAPKKAAAKKPAKKAAAKKPAVKRKPNAAFMKPMTPSSALAAIVGALPLPRTGPAVGEHNDEVYRALGLEPEEIEKLAVEGVI